MDATVTPPLTPLRLLVCAMGGEGGGVLTGWIVAAAQAEGLAVQATSVPGVAQRTGGTTYYIEMAPHDGSGRAPVFALVPVAGQVDVVLASELLEAARAARTGFVTPERTQLIASTHRVFLIQEKMAMSDGRLDPAKLEEAAGNRARQATLMDMDRLSRETGAPISAVMLGALAGSEALPIPRQRFEDAIKASGIAVKANLTAFAAAHEIAASGGGRARAETGASAPVELPDTPAAQQFPPAARSVIAIAETRLTDYQDAAYAALYRRRLEPFAAADPVLCREVGRLLALRMSYEDVIRVAQLKARPERFTRIRDEIGVTAQEPFEVRDFFKPGVNEIADILPPKLARWLRRRAARNPKLAAWHVGMQLKTTTVTGYTRVWLLARLRSWRRRSYRYHEENGHIDAWLGMVRTAAEKGDTALAREIAQLARLIKGYGETHARGSANYQRIVETLVTPALTAAVPPAGSAEHIRTAREAALADPEGASLDQALADKPTPTSPPEPETTTTP